MITLDHTFSNKENFIIKYVKTKHSQNWESNFINSELFKASKLKLIKEYPTSPKLNTIKEANGFGVISNNVSLSNSKLLR